MSDRDIHLPALLSDITGVPRSLVRRAIALGEVRVNGEPWTDLDLPDGTLAPDGYIEHPWGDEVRDRRARGLI